MSKPTGKLAFAYETIRNMESKIETYKLRIAELEGQLANEKIEVAKLNANVSGKTHRIAELKEKLANREPFVVKIPDYHYVLGCPCVWVDEIKAAITAAGGVCE